MNELAGQRFVTADVAARRLGCSRESIYRYVREGMLPARQCRRRMRLRIPVEALENLAVRSAADD